MYNTKLYEHVCTSAPITVVPQDTGQSAMLMKLTEEDFA